MELQKNEDLIIPLSTSDRMLIESEHMRLEQFLSDLCDTCSEFLTQSDCRNCSREKIATCQGRLPSFFYDFLDLVAEHCEHEEQIMQRFPHIAAVEDYLQRHQRDHVQIMKEVRQLIQDATAMSRQGNVAVAIRHFYKLVKERFSEHARSFDNVILQA